MRYRGDIGRRLVRAAIAATIYVLFGVAAQPASAQDTPRLPDTASEPQGFIPEPTVITRATLFADRHFGKGDLNNGFYVDFANMIPGAGWLAAGPGYRQWFAQDRVFVDGAAAISWNRYKTAQARIELPKVPTSRLALGAQVQWVDFGHVDYFGEGPDSLETAATEYGITATHLSTHASFRPVAWLDVGGQIGWLAPSVDRVEGFALPGLPLERSFVPSQAWAALDTRDFPQHPTRGTLVRVAASHYDDRDGGDFTFNRYESEAAAFVPLSESRVVVAVHGWLVSSDPREGATVPFYLLPSLGGANTLRSYADYRFHDRHSLLTTVEARIAMMTHLDAAVFVDAGNVASRLGDLDLGKRSYGAGLRLHTRRATFARVDVAFGDEGWRWVFRLTDPMSFSRLTRGSFKTVPFVP
jgi:hypothetical protein